MGFRLKVTKALRFTSTFTNCDKSLKDINIITDCRDIITCCY
jgi:hypothetical protein